MVNHWSQVLYKSTNVFDHDLYDALRCFGDVSRDFCDYMTPSKLNTRLGQVHDGDKTLMCELWVYRNVVPGIPALALALDRSLKRVNPLDRTTEVTRDRWVVTLGIRRDLGFASDRIMRIVKEKLVDEQMTGKAFSFLWHARHGSAQDEYDPGGSEVDRVFREILDNERDDTVPLYEPGTTNLIKRADLKVNGRPHEDAYAHYEDFLTAMNRPLKLRVIDFKIN